MFIVIVIVLLLFHQFFQKEFYRNHLNCVMVSDSQIEKGRSVGVQCFVGETVSERVQPCVGLGNNKQKLLFSLFFLFF